MVSGVTYRRKLRAWALRLSLDTGPPRQRRRRGWQLDGLLAGRYGMIARMTGSGPDPMVRGDFIPWDAIAALDDGLVRVRDALTR